VVRLLLERGADPTIATGRGSTPLMAASSQGHLEVVRLLLGHPAPRPPSTTAMTRRPTALWWACYMGRGGVVRALLESGADPTIADNDGTTPMAIAKQEPPPLRSGTLRRGPPGVRGGAGGEILCLLSPSPPPPASAL
jgi:ankyrin repeat protein